MRAIAGATANSGLFWHRGLSLALNELCNIMTVAVADAPTVEAAAHAGSSSQPSVDRPPYSGAALEAHVQRSWDYFKSLGSPKWHVAPMVDQSELPFRMLCRAHGAEAAYTPMLHSRLFLEQHKYREEHFSTCPGDRPLFIQFCANDPDTFVAAAQIVQEHADYIDLNLGCPQRIAKRGFYGAFLMDDLQLIEQLVTAAASRLAKPVSCKIRLFPDISKTIEYARMLQAAGCSLLAVHGRLRECKDNSAVRADWDGIAAVRAAVQIPVLANGDVQCMADAQRLMAHTKADGVMSAEPLLSDPALFSSSRQPEATISHMESYQVCVEYLDLVASYPSHARMVKGHVHKLLRGWLAEFTELRERIQRDASGGDLTVLRSLVAELGEQIAATGRDYPIPKLTERKLKQMEKEAAKQTSIQEQEREAAGLAAIGAAVAAEPQQQQQQLVQQQQQETLLQQQQQEGREQPQQLGKQAAGDCLDEPAQKRQQTMPAEAAAVGV